MALVRRLYLDSVCMLALSALSLVVALSLPIGLVYSALCVVLSAALLALAVRTADRSDDAGAFQERGAAQIAQVVSAKYIVMGHSHGPKTVPLAKDRCYINLGNWGEDDLPEDRPENLKAPCTHLCIADDGSGAGYRHALLRWDAELGALPFTPERPEAEELRADTALDAVEARIERAGVGTEREPEAVRGFAKAPARAPVR